MKKLKWITISNYVEEETGLVLTKKEVVNDYIIKEKVIIRKKTQYDKYYKEVVGIRDYEGITTITNICTKCGKQLKLFND